LQKNRLLSKIHDFLTFRILLIISALQKSYKNRQKKIEKNDTSY